MVLAAALLLARPAYADETSDEFTRHYKRAVELYKNHDYSGAQRELNIAYALKPLPALLLNLGHAYLDQGHGAEALGFYERYLREEPSLTQAQRDDVAKYQAQAQALVAASAPATPPAAVVVQAAPPAAAGHRLRTLSIGVGAGGALLTVAGVTLLGVNGRYGQECWMPGDITTCKQTDHTNAAGGVLLGAGIAALVGGGVLFYLDRRHHAQERRVAAILP